MEYKTGDKVVYISNKPHDRFMLKRPIGEIVEDKDNNPDYVECVWSLENGDKYQYGVYTKNIKILR
jgi:hypothetical protein